MVKPIVSTVLLERPGKWRTIGIVSIFLVATLPALPLLWQVTATGNAWSLGGGFFGALSHSLVVALVAAALAFFLGLPVGVLAALYEFPGRKIFLALATLPLVVPSVLWAIGWSSLLVRFGPAATQLLSGIPGCIFVFSATIFPLVMLARQTHRVRRVRKKKMARITMAALIPFCVGGGRVAPLRLSLATLQW